ncbi:MAG: LrgB family protein [Erysipelotrichaceae bacterium]
MLENAMFGLVLTLIGYQVGQWVFQKTKIALLNPLVVAVLFIILFLKGLNISYETYQIGGSMISTFLAPATACLGVTIYKQRRILKNYFVPVFSGALVGSITSIATTYFILSFFNVEQIVLESLLAKNVTTAIAIGITERFGGIVPLTIVSVLLAGIVGYVGAEKMCEWFQIKDEVAQGIAIGAASHALGTTKALEMSDLVAAMSSLSLAISGIMTLVLLLFV